MNGMEMNELPVVVVGAGPIGLAAATQLRERGLIPLVFERGPAAGAAVSQWNHVRLFSRWGELIDPAARRLLEATGWTAPAQNSYPTGRKWTRDYLVPLADALGAAVQFDTEVIGVARRGRDRVVDAGRDSEPLTVHVRRGDGSEDRIVARAVIDRPEPGVHRTRSAAMVYPPWASGTQRTRSPTGSRTSMIPQSAPATPDGTP